MSVGVVVEIETVEITKAGADVATSDAAVAGAGAATASSTTEAIGVAARAVDTTGPTITVENESTNVAHGVVSPSTLYRLIYGICNRKESIFAGGHFFHHRQRFQIQTIGCYWSHGPGFFRQHMRQ